MIGTSDFQEVRSSAPRSSTNRLLHEQPHRFGKVPGAVSVLLMLLAFAGHIAFHTEQAHGVTSITHTTGAGDFGTQVLLPIGHVYGITGGTPVGTNLYHSFAQFNVGTGDIAQFQTGTIPNIEMLNILGRITDANPSTIFGTIDSATFYPNANLFLMNPYGFLFGPGAMVNVGGMVAFTSADYLRLANGALFNAMPNATADALLSAAPVAAFGFLGSNPGAITVQGSQFAVTDGRNISLVGGNISIESGTPDGGTAQPAHLSAPNGQILLATAASPGEFDAATLQPLPNVNNTSFTSFGSASLAPGSNINVSGENTVSIRGGQFVLSVNNAVLSTADSAGAPATISLSPGSSMISSNAGADAGADMQLNASTVQIDGASIQSLTTGEGAGGNISITAPLAGGPISSTAGSVQIKGGQIQTASLGPAKVGDIQINSNSLSMTDGALIDTLLVPNPLIPGQPGGGTIAITATDSIVVTGQRLGTTTLLPSVPGLPTFTNLPSGIYSENVSANTGSRIVIQTPSLTLQPGLIDSHTFGAGAGGDVSLLLGQLTLKDGGLITSNTFGTGSGASLQIRASDSITMSGFLPGTFQFGPVVLRDVGSNIANVTYGLGQAGSVFVSTSTLTMNGANISSSTHGSGGASDVNIQAATISLTEGAGIGASTLGSGSGGTVSVTASEQLSISGRSGRSLSFGSFTAVNNPSAITAMTLRAGRAGALTVNTPSLIMFDGGLISTATGGDSPAGSITVNAGSINVNSGASISSSSGFDVGVGGFLFGNGAGGTVTVNATGPVTIADQGSGLFTNTVGTGAGGNIFVNADSVLIENGGTLSAATSGLEVTATGGTITVEGNTLQLDSGGTITARSTGSGNAGNVTIQGHAGPADSVVISGIDENFNPSGIFTDTQATGAGGNIHISAKAISLQDNGTLSAEASGTNNGGNIEVVATTIDLRSFANIATLGSAGNAGNITLKATRQITAVESFLDTDAVGGTGLGGDILLRAPTIGVNGGVLGVTTFGTGQAGNVLLEGQQISLGASPFAVAQGADLFAGTFGSGHGGTVILRGLDGPSSHAGTVTISGLSRIHTLTSSDGSAGDITINAAQFTLTDHATLNADTLGSGGAGAITITATDHATVSGRSTTVSSSSDFGATGNAGQIRVSAPTVMIENGGHISTNTTGEGTGGNIDILASHSVTMTNGSSISASSSSAGNAGNIMINAGQNFLAANSSVTTQADASSGGTIEITTAPSGTVHLTDSLISASVLDGTGGGGSVNIDPLYVLSQNSQILAQAVQGPGGNITINITNGGLFLFDANSVISASSQFGVNGTITIQSPNAPISGHVQPLGKTPLIATSLLNQHCAALAGGQFSSFTVAGRDSLPTEPGSWLASPLYAAGVGPEVKAEGVSASAGQVVSGQWRVGDRQILSLRQIAPAGFLTQAFAVEGSTSCQS